MIKARLSKNAVTEVYVENLLIDDYRPQTTIDKIL